MSLVVFLRGVNVGGHRNFRPSLLARELSDYDVVNIGAAGTLVVRKPGSAAKFRAELLRRLPFEADVMICQGRDLVRLANDNPFGKFVSGAGRCEVRQYPCEGVEDHSFFTDYLSAG